MLDIVVIHLLEVEAKLVFDRLYPGLLFVLAEFEAFGLSGLSYLSGLLADRGLLIYFFFGGADKEMQGGLPYVCF